ncbi:MAG: DUF3426 domain-containing protein [Sulfuricella sp.]|nr:DUF3426 domain-containing protein [Sulfuricella sp.]
MVMSTTCPACHTRFRVTPEQMDAHGGDVRCGRCAKVFNAHVYLEHELEELQHEGQSRLAFEEPGEQAALPEEEANQPAAVEELAAPSFEEAPVEEEPVQPPQAVDELLPESPVEAESFVPEWGEEALSEPPAAAESRLSEPAEPVTVEPVDAESITLPPRFSPGPVPERPVARDTFVEIEDKLKKRRFFWLWLIGVLLLLASLGAQGVYFFRSDLAARYPEFKPFLQQFCGVPQCSIRLPANPDLLSIETSNLEADPQQDNLVALNAILRNRAKLAQEYPQLELTLTDTQDRMIARRTFTPGEYAKGADLNRGMAPNEEVTVKLNLDLGDLKAAGYRVFLFYPQ